MLQQQHAPGFTLHGLSSAGAQKLRHQPRSELVMVDASEIEAIQRKIEILKMAELRSLQAELKALQEQAPGAAPTVDTPTTVPLESVAPLIAPPIAPLESVASTVAPAPTVDAPPFVPELAANPVVPLSAPLESATSEAVAPPAAASLPSMFMDPAAPNQMFPDKCFGDECIATVLKTPAGESNEIAQSLAQGLGVFVFVPVAYLAATKFAEFVNQRYEEINGEVGGGNVDGGAARSTDAPSPYPWRK